MRCTFNLGIFSEYRSQLMGIATLLIIICHIPLFGVVMPQWMNTIMASCGFGVDIFLFLSGLGMYNSYNRRIKNGMKLKKWMVLRYLRIMCPLVILVFPFVSYQLFSEKQAVFTAILQLSGFGPLFGKGALWFIPCILLLYLFTPILNWLMKQKRNYVWMVELSFFCYLFAYLPPNDGILHFIINRWPIYFLGFALADSVNKKKESSVLLFMVYPLLLYVFFYILNHGLETHFCLFGLQGILMVTFFALLINAITNAKLSVFLNFWGLISLESYITNEYVLRALQNVSWKVCGIDISCGNWTFYVVGTCLCAIISFCANRISKKILSFI